MISSESWMREIRTSSLTSEDWKRGHGSRTEARSESDGTATGPLRWRASPGLYCIDRNAGWFLTRLPASANPRIVGTHRRWRGRSVALEGHRLDDVASRLRRATLDVEVEVEFKRRVYAGHRRRLRLIAVRDPASARYWFYLTNITPEALDAEELAQLYACRWQIELVFKELKSHYRLDELHTRKAPVVEALILSSVITLLVSRRLLDAVRRRLPRLRHRIPEGRWASLFAAVSLAILDLLILPLRTAKALARRLEPMILCEVIDPNASRLLLLQRVDQRLVWSPAGWPWVVTHPRLPVAVGMRIAAHPPRRSGRGR